MPAGAGEVLAQAVPVLGLRPVPGTQHAAYHPTFPAVLGTARSSWQQTSQSSVLVIVLQP